MQIEIDFLKSRFYLRDVYYPRNSFFRKIRVLSKDKGTLFSSRPHFLKRISGIS